MFYFDTDLWDDNLQVMTLDLTSDQTGRETSCSPTGQCQHTTIHYVLCITARVVDNPAILIPLVEKR